VFPLKHVIDARVDVVQPDLGDDRFQPFEFLLAGLP
jgi:hypothetical protein